ncbi:MAG TPA: alpha/beta fold hydrolase [Myxococcaceae bacterium]|nr:alpha/beta fold hydrolase [Myxococcaceae bacterium]
MLGATACPEAPTLIGDAGLDAGSPDAGADAGTSFDGGLVASRPYPLVVPPGYAGQPTPLVILLHGYGASGAEQEAYFQLTPVAKAQTFLYAYPDGTLDSHGLRFWNATDACCNFDGRAVDDVAYLNAVIDDVERKYNVDPKRVFLVGHSNGGFMAHRMACDASARVAAMVSLAGAQWDDISRCQPSQTVAVLQVHGTADLVIAYDGGSTGVGTGAGLYPAARTTVGDWAAFDGCGALDTSAPNLDLDTLIPGPETTVGRYLGCDGGTAELWSIQGGSHVPSLTPNWGNLVYGFLSAHARP